MLFKLWYAQVLFPKLVNQGAIAWSSILEAEITMTLFRGFSSLLLAATASLSFNVLAQPAVSPPAPVSAASAVPSAAATAAADNTVLMRGPGGDVTLAQVRAAVDVIVPPAQRDHFMENPRNIEQLALSIYVRQTLAAEARKQGFDRQPDIAQLLAVSQLQVLGDLWLLHKSKEGEPTAAQLEKYARSVYESQPSKKTEDGKPVDFESQRAELMEQARGKLINQARAEVWNTIQAGAKPDAEAIAAQVRPPAGK